MPYTSLFAPPPALAASIQPTVSSLLVIDQAVAQLEALTIPSDSGVPGLGLHIQAAKDHARLWLSLVRGEVVGALSGIVTWNATFRNTFTQLAGLARAIAQGQTQLASAFDATLGELQALTDQQAKQSQTVRPALLSFLATVDGDARAFAQDESALATVLSSAQDSVANLQQEADHLRSKLKETQIEEAALSFLNPLFWVLKKLIDSLTGQLDGTERQLSQAQSQLDEARRQVQQVSQTKAVLDQYTRASGSITQGIDALSTGWDTLRGNFSMLRDAEDIDDIVDQGEWGASSVEAVLLDWSTLALQVQNLLGGTIQTFRILHVQTGQYITMSPGDAAKATLRPVEDSNQLFVLEKLGEGDYRVKNVRYNVYLTYFSTWKFLGGYGSTGYEDQHWNLPDAKSAGLHLANRWSGFGGINQLFYRDNDFGLYFGEYNDQLWLLQYEH